jgi:hypothetical protein
VTVGRWWKEVRKPADFVVENKADEATDMTTDNDITMSKDFSRQISGQVSVMDETNSKEIEDQ